MVELDQVITLPISPKDFVLAKQFAGSAVMGGMGHVIQDAVERERLRALHQLVGQLGMVAGHRYLFGHLDLLRENRGITTANPYAGDGGTDVPGANIDFKSSLRRYKDKGLLTYNLWVREPELHENTVYLLILIDVGGDTATAHLIGWADTKMLRAGEIFEDSIRRYGVRAKDLYPLPPLFWKEEWTAQRLLSSHSPVGV